MTLISGVVASVIAIGCKSDNSLGDLGEDRIEGQLFIVQKNRENVKLGDVKVVLVERSTFDDALVTSARQSRYLEGLLAYKKQLSIVTKQVEGDAEVYKRSQDDFVRGAADYALRKLKKDKLTFNNTEFVKVMSGQLAVYNDYKDGFKATQFEGDFLQKWCLSYLFHTSKIYTYLDVTTTDADGKFSLNVPSNKDCLVLANSSRALMGDKEENYYWAHPVDPKVKGAFILSNSNMISASRLHQMLAASSVDLKSLPPEVVKQKYKLPSLEWYLGWREAMRGYDKAEREEDRLRDLMESNKIEMNRLIRERTR